jgi:molybdopterin-guanine dinucleotide biosynthesis protein A
MLTAGFVLVGGQSRRMGRDKALLPWKTGVLADEMASKLAAVTGTAVLIGDPAKYAHLGYPCLPDLRTGLGPLSGIEAALASARAELNLILACDLPGIEVPHLRRLLTETKESGENCTVTADASGAIQPLCAVYRSTCLPVVRNALDNGRLKLMDVVKQLQGRAIPVANVIDNINSPEEWKAVLRDA